MSTATIAILGLFAVVVLVLALAATNGAADATPERPRPRPIELIPSKLDEWEATVRDGCPLSLDDQLDLIESVRRHREEAVRLRARIATAARPWQRISVVR